MAAPTYAYDIFLSHNRAQKDWTRDLARRLRDDGFGVWFDEWVLPKFAGRNWIDMLAEGVEQSRKVALVWSPEFFTHDWPEFESSIIQQIDVVGRNDRVLPILHTRCDLPRKWGFRQGLDFVGYEHGTVEFEFRYQQLLYNLDGTRPFEPDLEEFKAKWRAAKPDPEKIPPVSPLPKGSRMSHASSALFVGRENELRELARSLTPGAGTVVGVHAVTGLGGVGKTQLAIEYAHRYGRQYPGGVFWLNMESAGNTINEVAACGGPQGMDLPNFNDLKTPEQAERVLKLWREGDACLLIFDNAEDPEMVNRWRPVSGRCSVLITSRRPEWPLEMGLRALEVETLPRANSLEMLEKARPKLAERVDERNAANELCDLLGDLPLALKVAAAYLQKYRAENIAAYLADLRTAIVGGSELREVWACFAVSYRKLRPGEETDALALRLFDLAAHFAPVSISRLLLAQAADLDHAKRDQQHRFSAAAARLRDLSLIGEEPDGRLLLHRLLRQFARAQNLEGLSQEQAAKKVWEALRDFAHKELEGGLPQELTRELAHLREAATEAEGREPGLAASLYNELGAYADDLALMDEAKADYQRALKLGEQAYGPDSSEVAAYSNNIGHVLRERGELAGALEYASRALKTEEKIYGSNHPDVAIVANSIGLILWEQGDLVGAQEYTQRALTIGEQAYGPDHPDVAIWANNIGLILREQGNLAGALEYTQRALKIDEQVYGTHHPSVARDASNIGLILQDQGELAGALEYMRRAHNIFEKVYGPDHPSVARNANNIGLILKAKGDMAGALEYTQWALRIDKQVYGPDHSQVAIECNNLGAILHAQGNLAGALEYMQRALKIDEQVYGPDHPNVARDANNIGQILRAQGDLMGSLEYMQRALNIFQRVYGPDHPQTRRVAGNLRSLQEAGG